jgi:hypothetical protein
MCHSDLNPDKLLIDHCKHLMLKDSGLSKMGLLGRQVAEIWGTMSLLRSSQDGNLDKRKLFGLATMDITLLSNPGFLPWRSLLLYDQRRCWRDQDLKSWP